MQNNMQNVIGKKGKAPASEKSKITLLFTDTTCTKEVGISIWEGMYRLLEEEKLRVMAVTITVDGRGSSEASLIELACSFLHRVAARPNILPYIDMEKWIIDHDNISDKEFNTWYQEVMGSFTPSNLRHMYHLPKPQASYKKQFMEKFAKENEDLADCTKSWSTQEEPLKKDKNVMYATGSLCSPYCFTAAILCRLFGKRDINKFSSKWLPLLDAATNGTIMDWAQILLDNLASAILNY